MRCLHKKWGHPSPDAEAMPPHGVKISGDYFKRSITIFAKISFDPVATLTYVRRYIVLPPVNCFVLDHFDHFDNLDSLNLTDLIGCCRFLL